MLQASSTLLVLLNHVPLARPIAKHLSKGLFRVPLRKIEPILSHETGWIMHKISKFPRLRVSQRVRSRFNRGSRVKTRGKIFTGHVTLLVAHFDWPRFLFLHFLAGFSARCRATMLRTIAPRSSLPTLLPIYVAIAACDVIYVMTLQK